MCVGVQDADAGVREVAVLCCAARGWRPVRQSRPALSINTTVTNVSKLNRRGKRTISPAGHLKEHIKWIK